MSEQKPNPVQRVRYICGATLPPSMQQWVLRDLTGPGAARRYLVRFLVPIIPCCAFFSWSRARCGSDCRWLRCCTSRWSTSPSR